jgi:hypothetical protein
MNDFCVVDIGSIGDFQATPALPKLAIGSRGLFGPRNFELAQFEPCSGREIDYGGGDASQLERPLWKQHRVSK